MVSVRSGGVGGKIVTNRRKQRLNATPYDRPQPAVPEKSPNWLTGIVVPKARALAYNAGQILTSILYDSDSSSSEDGYDSGEEDDVEKRHSELDEANEIIATQSQKRSGTETKQLIEKLIGHETFSGEERDKLIRVLNSRVVDPSVESREINVFNSPPSKVLDQAVQEAKKWFQNDRSCSTSTSKFPPGTIRSDSIGIKHVEHGGGSSPVDVAKSYLKGKGAWTLSSGHSEVHTPLANRAKLFREGMTQSVGHDSFSSSRKRGCFTSGLFNIQEELRRVRSKAIDDLLHTSSTKADPLASFTSALNLGSLEAGIRRKDGKLMETEPNKDGGMSSVLALAAPKASKNVAPASELSQSKSAAHAKNGDDDQAEPTPPGHAEESLPTDAYSDKQLNGDAENPRINGAATFPNTSVDAAAINGADSKNEEDVGWVLETDSSQKSGSLGGTQKEETAAVASKPKKSGRYSRRERRKP